MISTRLFSATKSPEANKAVAAYVAMKIFGKLDSFGLYCTLGVYAGEELIGAVVYHNYHPDHGTIELSAAAEDKRWLTKPVLRAIFDTAFKGLGVQACLTQTPARNETMIKIWERVGASGCLIPRLFGRSEDGWVFSMSDDVWYSSRYVR